MVGLITGHFFVPDAREFMHTVMMKYITFFAMLCLTIFTAPSVQASSCFPTGIMVAKCKGTTCKKGFEFYTSKACGNFETQDAQTKNLRILSRLLVEEMDEIPAGIYEVNFWNGGSICFDCEDVAFSDKLIVGSAMHPESVRQTSYPNLMFAKVIIKLRASTPPVVFILNIIIGVLIFRVLSEKMGYVYKSILGFSALILILVAIYLYVAIGFEGTWVAVSTILVLLLFKFFKTKPPAPVP